MSQVPPGPYDPSGAPTPPPPGHAPPPPDAGWGAPPADGGWGPPPSGADWGSQSGEEWGPEPGYDEPPEPGSSSATLVILLAVIAVLVVGGGAFFLMGGSDDEESSSSSTTIAGQGAGSGEDDSGDSSGSDDGGSDGDEPAATADMAPEEVVDSWIQAGLDADCAALYAVTTDEMHMGMDEAMFVEDCEAAGTANDPTMTQAFETMELVPVQFDDSGDVATVRGFADIQGSSLEMVFTLVNEGGGWLIDNVA